MPLTASGSLSTSAFRVEDNGTPVTISDADIVGTNTVVLTLASPTSTTTITVSLGFDETGAGAVVPTDSTTYNLPAEIFIDEAASADSAPTIAEVTPVTTPTSDSTPNYTFSSTEAGTITYGGSCSSATTAASSGSNTIAFNTLADGTYTNCTIIVADIAGNNSNTITVTSFTVDTTSPIIAEVTPVTTPTSDATPDYTFSSTEAGTITYGGDCSSATTSASSGSNTIAFNTLADGVHSNCTIRVADALTQQSNLLSVTSFTINTSTAPDAPTNLQAVAGDTEVDLTWNAPVDDGGSAITDYLIEYKLSSDSSWTTFSDGTSTATSTTVTSLTNDLAYDFRVSAINAVGTSSSSSTDSATPTGVPVTPSPSPSPTSQSTRTVGGYTTNPSDMPGSTAHIISCLPGALFDSVTGIPCGSTPSVASGTFTRNLKTGAIGEDVRALQKYLNTHGFLIALSGPGSLGNETQLFGALTRAALIRFQEAHAAQILTPLGLTKGTGFFGSGTRDWILKNF